MRKTAAADPILASFPRFPSAILARLAPGCPSSSQLCCTSAALLLDMLDLEKALPRKIMVTAFRIRALFCENDSGSMVPKD